MTLELRCLPARQGDAIWVRWHDGERWRQLLVDMGTAETGRAIRSLVAERPEDERAFELLVVSHVDGDHIGGVLSSVVDDPLDGFAFGDVWFNGWAHLDGQTVPPPAPDIEPMGPAQGEELARWLEATEWNGEFDRGPVEVDLSDLRTIHLDGGLRLTLIGPTRTRLEELKPVWKDEVELAISKGRLDPGEVSPGLEPMGSKTPPTLETSDDLTLLAETVTNADPSEANGSSISMILEFGDFSALLCGDAFGDDLVSGLLAFGGGVPPELDLVKLPHHGSKSNVTREFVEAVRSPDWLVSTDGTQHRHPDAIAIARVIEYALVRQPRLLFNVRSTFNGWWDDDDWRTMYGYRTAYGASPGGIVVPVPT